MTDRAPTAASEPPATGPFVHYVLHDHVATITIDRPGSRNAVDGAVARGIEAAVDALESDDQVRVGILTGTPPDFCAGADLRAVAGGDGPATMTARGGFAGFVRRYRTKPVVAAVEGRALAGGTEIVLACDLVVAAADASFGIPEVRRGLVAAGGGAVRLGRRLPFNLALELALTGDTLDARAAYAHGLVNALCEPGDALSTAHGLASRIAANAPVAVRETRALMLSSTFADDETGWEAGRIATETVLATADFHEGVQAFLDKRPPVWRGR